MKQELPRCDWCGLFTGYDVVEKGGSARFTPDTEVTREEMEWRCPTCTEKYGKISLEDAPRSPIGI